MNQHLHSQKGKQSFRHMNVYLKKIKQPVIHCDDTAMIITHCNGIFAYPLQIRLGVRGPNLAKNPKLVKQLLYQGYDLYEVIHQVAAESLHGAETPKFPSPKTSLVKSQEDRK